MRFSMLYSGEQILSFKSCLVFYTGDSLSYFPFGFEGSMWDLIVSVSGHCLSFYFENTHYMPLCCQQL